MRALTQAQRARVYEVALAALLHDVGKLAQRAEAEPERYRSLSNLHEFATTDREGRVQYHHAAYTWQFIADHLPWLLAQGEGGDENIAGWASRHHKPSSAWDWTVTESDRLSAGMDRGHPDEANRGWSHVQTSRLTPLLGRVRGNPSATEWETPLRPVRLDETIFPRRAVRRGQREGADEYRDLFHGFTAAARRIPTDHLGRFFQSFLAVYERFAWCIPAATNATPCDVSLFEHSKAASAVAAALTAELLAADTTIIDREVRNRTVPRYLLAVGDLSGIQRFIYTIVTDNAARALRGRSFALQLLADGIGAYLLDRIGLPPSNVLYSGGGKLWMLVPAAAAATLRSDAESIDLALQEQYGGRLGFSMGLAPLTGDDLVRKIVAKRWGEATTDLHQQRRRRLARAARVRYQAVFGAFGTPGQDTLCHVCGRLTGSLSGNQRCTECQEFERLGQLLTWARCVARVRGDGWHARVQRLRGRLPKDSKDWYWELPDLLNGAYLLSTGDTERIVHAAEAEDVVLALNDVGTDPAGNAGMGCLLAGLNRPHREDGVTLTFDDMAKKSSGIDRLGILRMDLDNLGDLFANGLDEGERSISRITNLSKSLAYFFGGIISAVVEREDAPWSNHAQVIYSGGDDVFIVGSWSVLPGLARAIRREFCRFTAENQAWGISAGIAIVRPRHPIASAARIVGKLEEDAKKVRLSGKGKDALALLGDVMPWDDVDSTAALAAELLALTSGETGEVPGFDVAAPAEASLPRSWLHRLQLIADTYRRALSETNGRPRSLAELEDATRRGRWAWNAAYALARTTRNPGLSGRLTALVDALPQKSWPAGGHGRQSERDLIWLIKPAALWAEYLSRREES